MDRQIKRFQIWETDLICFSHGHTREMLSMIVSKVSIGGLIGRFYVCADFLEIEKFKPLFWANWISYRHLHLNSISTEFIAIGAHEPERMTLIARHCAENFG